MRKLKQLSSLVQSPLGSFKRHNRQYEESEKIKSERFLGKKNIEENLINFRHFRTLDLLEKHPNVQTAVDMGCGTGWASAALAKKVAKIIAFEPSEAALNMARQIYPENEYPNIEWKHGFAENVLPKLKLDSPTLFITGCVLSHLRDKEVLIICKAMSSVAPAGSALSFSEGWNDKEWHQLMWHIRTKEWWQQALPDWGLDFYGPIEDGKNYHMGFWGVKK